MGNGLSCPVGFTPATGLTCAMLCPANKGLENRVVGSEARCVYTRDPTKFVALRTAPMVLKATPQDPAPTLQWMQTNRPAEYTAYTQAQDDARSKLAVLLATLTRDQQITDAFQDLQSAENARDQSPQAYQTARNRYYTLVRGDTWEAQERTRVLNAEVLPELTPYVQSLRVASDREAQQATTKSAVDAVKSNLITLKNDFRTTTTTLAKQVTALRNQIELQKRRALESQEETSQWGLNVLLVVLSLLVIYVLVRRIMRKSPESSSSTQLSFTRPPGQAASTQTAGKR
jgi:hypothetical protein